MSVCPNCTEATFPDDLYCGNCGTLLPRVSSPEPFPQKAAEGVIKCRTCGHMNEPGSLFCELDSTALSKAHSTRGPEIRGGVLIMPDRSEITIQRTIRVFGRRDLIKFLKPEDSKKISHAYFTIIRENGVFYLQEGAPNRKNPKEWRPSANEISINGAVLEPGTKHKLDPADVIGIERFGLNLTFKPL